MTSHQSDDSRSSGTARVGQTNHHSRKEITVGGFPIAFVIVIGIIMVGVLMIISKVVGFV